MGKVETIENEVRHLSKEELAAFREWFMNFDGDAWDRQIEADAMTGKLDTFAAKALADHQRGGSREL